MSAFWFEPTFVEFLATSSLKSISDQLVTFTNHPPLLNILTFWNHSYLKTFDFEGLLRHLYQWINFNILPSYLVWALCPARFRHWARGSRETVGNLLNITLSLQSLLFSNYLLPLLICAVSNISSNVKTVHVVEGLPTDRATFIRSAKLGAWIT